MIRQAWDRLTRRERIAIVVALMALVAVGTDRWVVSPLAAHLQLLEQQVADAKAMLWRQQRILRLKAHADTEYERYKSFLQSEGTDEETLAQLHSEIERIARDTQIRLAMVKSRTPAKNGLFRYYAVDVEAEGDLDKLVRFLWRLGNSPRLLSTSGLRLYPAEGESGQVKVSLTITRILADNSQRGQSVAKQDLLEGDNLWTMKDEDLIVLAKEELGKLCLADPAKVFDGFVIRVPKAHPVFDVDYRPRVEAIRAETDAIENLQPIGRYGMYRYNNMDHSILTGLLAARNVMGSSYGIWDVNTGKEYHEEVRI